MADAHPARLQLPLPTSVSANRARRLLGLAPREALVAVGVAAGDDARRRRCSSTTVAVVSGRNERDVVERRPS
jgi:hypothetical protein